jgi:Dolichyl-phosphate-mannose-protein mannosyltransferase
MTISDKAGSPSSISRPSQTQDRSSIVLTRSNRAVWLGVVAFAVGGGGEALLFSEDARGLGLALLGLGTVLGVIAWRDLRDAPLLETRNREGRWIAWRRGLAIRVAGIALASCLSVGSVAAYLADPNALFGLQGVLWLAGMCLLLISCARWYPRSGGDAADQAPWTRVEGLVFGGLVALSLVTHLAFLNDIPWRFHFDEAIAFTETMRYYRGPMIPLFTTTWFDTSLPSLWFSIAAGWMRLVGPGLAGVRVGVAFIGAVTVIPVYGLARLAWGRLAAGLAGFAVAVSAAYVHYSRVSIINVTTAFSWAVCFYFLLRGLRSRRPGDFVWAGLAAGTGMYTYYGTRLLPVLLLTYFVIVQPRIMLGAGSWDQ